MGQHDLSYRLFFAHRRMIQDLLREIVGEQWVDLLDLDSGVQVGGSFVSPRHENRESDVIWRFRRKDGRKPRYVYVLMEFQSRPDPSMPVRLMGYESLLYQSLMKGRPASGWKNLPLVIAVVVYNGWKKPWRIATELGSLIGGLDPSSEVYRPRMRYLLVDESKYPREKLAAQANPVAALFYIEQSRDWQEVRAGVDRLREMIPLDESSLREAFLTWLIKVILPRFGLSPKEADEVRTLEEFSTMLAEKIDSWNDKIREEGLQEGRKQERVRMLLRQLHLKFRPLPPEVEERVRSTDADRLLEWSDRVLTAERLQDVFGD
jgi:predicted transposase/invertase (TIGR01784 family)